MFKKIQRSEFEHWESLANIIGIRVVTSYISASIEELTKAFQEDPNFSTLDRHHWNHVNCFDPITNLSRIAAAGQAFRYKLKINYRNFAISVDDIVKIMKHVATFHILKINPQFDK